MIDRASLNVKGDEVTFWTARVLPSEMLVPGNNALHGQVRQRWTANCALQQLTALSRFYLDNHSSVLAGNVQTDLKAIGPQSLGADERQLVQVALITQLSKSRGSRQLMDHTWRIHQSTRFRRQLQSRAPNWLCF
ncbi:hypothetical protein [Pseudomonas sp. RT6P73]